jgi:hypothetical protein
LGTLSATTALTDGSGLAVVSLAPSDSTRTGADTVSAVTSVSGQTGSASAGFQLTATSASFTSVSAAAGLGDTASTKLGPYGQSIITVVMGGVNESAPATVSLGTSCVAAGKASLSPASVTTTSGIFSVSYTDIGCGALLGADTVTATLAGSGKQKQGSIFLTSPVANSLTFVSATPATIYLKGSGLTESSTVQFQLQDTAGNPLPGQKVVMSLTTYAGGLAIDGGTSAVTKTTDAQGKVQVIVNSGTVPTPVRVSASLQAGGASTVSNILAVGVGLPSQLAFSLSQETINIECYSRDGIPNTYTVFAADRSGNPVPEGTALTFWAEGGQVATSVQTTIDSRGIASASAGFVCQEPRPTDGRVTILAYALGEESFVDLNGNNQYDAGEPFQDLGDISKDILWDNVYDDIYDEYVSLSGVAAGNVRCDNSVASTYEKFQLSAYTPVRSRDAGGGLPAINTCDGKWTQRTYVRRAVETVMSTSSAGLVWGSVNGLDGDSCHPISLQPGSVPGLKATYYAVLGGDTWYGGSLTGFLPLLVADANPIRLNPMAAGTVLSTANASTGLTVTVAGSPVANTSEAPSAGVAYELKDVTSGQFTLNVASPSGLTTSYSISINSKLRSTICP